MCNREYSIIKFLGEGREQAILRLFERILIVPLVTHEINRKLAKWENYNQQLVTYQQQVVVREQQLERQAKLIETQRQQIEDLNQKIENKDEIIQELTKELKLVNSDLSNRTESNEKLKRDNEISKYAMGIVGAVCVPAVCIYPPVGAGMLAFTVIGFVAAKNINDSSSESTDITEKKEQ